MVGIRSVGVGERKSDDSFVCLGANLTQRACARDCLRDRKKTRKGKVPEQSAEWSYRQSGKGDGQREAAAEVRSWDLWTQKPGQPAREDDSAFQVAVWKFRSDTRSR